MSYSSTRCPKCGKGFLEYCQVGEDGKLRTDLPFLKEAICSNPECAVTVKAVDAPEI